MVNCPRCGFAQPKDQYCAKCGVDMQTFVPRTQPIWVRVLNHPGFYVSVVVLVLLTLIFFIRQHQKEEIADKVRALKTHPLVNDRTILPSNLPSSMDSKSNPSATSETTIVPNPSTLPPDPLTPPAAKTPSNDSITMTVLYAEVDHDTMEMLRNETLSTQQHTDFGDFKAGALSAKIHPSRERGVRILERVNKKFEANALSQRWFVGRKTSADSEEGLGLTTLVSLEAATPNSLKGEIEIQRNLFEESNPEEGPVRKNYPSTSFELTPGMSWMINLKLPLSAEDDPTGSADGFLRIFQSAQFKSKQTEFTVFFVFDNDKE